MCSGKHLPAGEKYDRGNINIVGVDPVILG